MRTAPLLAFTALGLAVCAFFACDDDTGTPPADYTLLLKDLTENVVLPKQNQFATDADALSAAATALATTTDEPSLAKLQQAWRTSRGSWRVLDAMHFGPIANDEIAERIDVAPASPDDIEAAVTATAPVNVPALGGKAKGFLGLQYLIFGSDALAKLQGDTTGRRRQLVTGIAAEIASSAHQVVDDWTPGKGGYQAQVETAGSGSTVYPTQRAAVDDFVGAVGYALEEIVGIRLAGPLGRKGSGVPNSTLDITSLSDNDVADLNASLAGVLALYDANSGFAARLKLSSASLATTMTTQFSDCGAKISAIPAPFVMSLTAHTTVVQAAYDSCKTSKETWNTAATPALGATVKPADTDGD